MWVLDRFKVYRRHIIDELLKFESLQNLYTALAGGSQLYIHQLKTKLSPMYFKEQSVNKVFAWQVEEQIKKLLSITVRPPAYLLI